LNFFCEIDGENCGVVVVPNDGLMLCSYREIRYAFIAWG